MLMVSLDHLPFSLDGFDGSVSIQQEFPLSGVLGARARAATADVGRFRADARRAELDVEIEALEAFYLIAERRGTGPILDEQITILGQLAIIARAHLGSGQGMQADVLRLDNERARLEAARAALVAETRAAEAMLNAALARAVEAPVPDLVWGDELRAPVGVDALARQALAGRPEIDAARAARRRADAEIDVMRSMYTPMAFVRAGPAYSMLEGPGAMAMVGVSLPIWRERLAAGVSEAQAMASMASADIDAMQRTIVGRVAVSREAVAALRTRLLALQNDVLPRARLVTESATGSFAGGQGSMLAVLDATRDLRDIRLQELMARVELGRAWAALRRETGELGGQAAARPR
jgi:outer membrane protein TolC